MAGSSGHPAASGSTGGVERAPHEGRLSRKQYEISCGALLAHAVLTRVNPPRPRIAPLQVFNFTAAGNIVDSQWGYCLGTCN